MDAQPAPAAVTGAAGRAAGALRSAGVASALAGAQLICAPVPGVDRSALPLADGLDPAEVAEVGRIVAARARDRTPLQYLLGRATSGRLDLAVGPGVFIPRPETELLVENALDRLKGGEGPGPIVVDLCAGSGTLAPEIAHARPDAYVHAVELHGPALEWLRRNAGERAAAGDTPVEVHAADATDPALLPDLRGRVAAVVANPPYIPQTDDLTADVLGHEPATALFGGADGLVVITPLVHVAAGLLAPGGHLAVEHDDATGAAVAAVVCAQGGFGNVDQHTDLAGRPRFVTATRRAETDDDEVDQTVRKGITR